MNADAWRRHRLRNAMQSVLLLAAMGGLLAGLGWVIAGGTGVAWALAGGAVAVVLNPGLSPRVVLRMYGARPLDPRAVPELHRVVAALARRAGLPAVPRLFYVPSRVLNAFAVGSQSASAIAVSDAMLRTLTLGELVGVLAHEVSHVQHNDTRVMGLADLFSRMTNLFSTCGQILLIVNLPLMAVGGYTVSWTVVLVLVFAPAVSVLMQLALSRTREHDADLGAAALTGDPRGLALALQKMERYQGGFIEQLFVPGRRIPDPSLLRTHPPTEERIRRLLEIAPSTGPLTGPSRIAALPSALYPAIARRPRRHASGLWY